MAKLKVLDLLVNIILTDLLFAILISVKVNPTLLELSELHKNIFFKDIKPRVI